jgi:hypothetical protein
MLGWHERGDNFPAHHKPTSADDAKVKLGGGLSPINYVGNLRHVVPRTGSGFTPPRLNKTTVRHLATVVNAT